MSRLSLVLAVGSSGTVAAAAVAGHRFTPPEVAGAFAMAGTIAALNRGRPQARPHVLQPLSEEHGGGVLIAAPQARNVAEHPSAVPGRSDAA